MKSIRLADAGQLRNDLARYRKGKKLEIAQFNQAARLAWLGRVVLAPLDPDDPECRAMVLWCERPADLAGELLQVDDFLYSRMHVVDAEQGAKLTGILHAGMQARAQALRDLDARDFYFDSFFDPEPRRAR